MTCIYIYIYNLIETYIYARPHQQLDKFGSRVHNLQLKT